MALMRANFEKTGIYETDLRMHICKRQVYIQILLEAAKLLLDSPCPTAWVKIFSSIWSVEVHAGIPHPERVKNQVTIQENVIVIHGILKPEDEQSILDRIIQLQTH